MDYQKLLEDSTIKTLEERREKAFVTFAQKASTNSRVAENGSLRTQNRPMQHELH